MMRLVGSFVVLALLAFSAPAEAKEHDVTLRGGWNVPGGLGVSYAYRFHPRFAGEVGAGLAGVGYRAALGGRFYFSNALEAGFVAASYGLSTGLFGEAMDLDVQTENGNRVVRRFALDPAHLVNLSIGRRWSFASDRGHFTLAAGYAAKLAGGTFEQEGTPVKLDAASEIALGLLEPGGLILDAGIGISF